MKNKKTTQEANNSTTQQPVESNGTGEGNRKQNQRGVAKKKRYWSRRPIQEQLLKAALPNGGSINVYFITGKPVIPHKL